MSKIFKELVEAAELPAKRNEAPAAHLARLITVVQDLDDKTWNGLSEAAQDWFNTAVDAVNAKKDIPDFPDAEKAEEAPSRRRRAAAEPEAEAEEAGDYEMKTGDEVTITTKRGKVVTGKLVEFDDDVLVIDDGEGETEYERARIDKITGPTASKKEEPAGRRRRAAEDEEVESPTDPEVGDEIKVTSKRGKVYEGELLEIVDGIFVIGTGKDEEEEIAIDLVKEVKIIKRGKKAAAKAEKEDEPAKGRRSTKSADKKDDEKPARASNGGVSVGNRIRELIVEDFATTEDDIAKQLKKEGLEFRPNTLQLVYAEVHKLLKLLKDAKKLK